MQKGISLEHYISICLLLLLLLMRCSVGSSVKNGELDVDESRGPVF